MDIFVSSGHVLGERVAAASTSLSSLIGLLIAFIASEQTVAVILGKALAQPQGIAVYQPEDVIRSLDVFVLLANVNLIGVLVESLLLVYSIG